MIVKAPGRFTSVTKAADNTEDLIIEGYANTVSKDRAGDVIPRGTWEKPGALDNYLKNPIILAYHKHDKPAGRMVDYDVTDQGLKIKAKISAASEIYHLVKDGTLSTFSVGFSIKDAKWDDVSDTYFITEVELHEISVVSIPCNQDSVFQISKCMTSQEFERFKTKTQPVEEAIQKEDKKMTEEEIKALLAKYASESKDSALEALRTIEAEKAAQAAKEAAEKAAKEANAKETKAVALEAAKELVKELEAKLAEKDNDFGTLVKAQEAKIESLKEEIAQVVASKNSRVSAITKGIRGIENDEEIAKTADALMFVSTIKKVPMEETELGKRVIGKAVNGSSSIAVSSDGYETTFSTNLMRDIQAMLVVAPLFSEMTMTTANMTIPINPDRSTATWVAAAAMADGADKDRTGGEITPTLTERTLTTFKLAAKTYLTEETQEDTIIAVTPILRQHLVEAHAKAIDAAFLIGTGNGQPKGLVTQANAVVGQNFTTTATANGSVKVTAAMILAARRGLGLYGIDLSKLYVIISQDAYWDLIEDAEWADVQQVGMASATKLVGEVGNIYGMRVLVSNEFAAKAASTAFGVIVNASNFIVPRQRGVTVRSDFDVELDRRVFVATQRLNLEPLILASAGNGKGVVSLKYAA